MTTNNHRILIVEDEAMIYMLLRSYLSTAGFSICPNAPDRDSALDIYFREKPDIVIMDINLARGTNGIDTAVEMKKNRPEIPVIFLTGYDEPEIRDRALREVDPLDYLTKPVVLPELMSCLERAL